MITVNEPGLVNGILATDDNIGSILTILQGAKDLAVDTETTGLNVRNKRDYLMGICIDAPGVATYIPLRHKTDNVSKRYTPYLWDILKSKPLIWHNRKFDMHSLATLGLDPLELKEPQYDTLMAFQLWNEELFSKELDFLAKRFLKLEKYEKDQINKMGDIYGRENLPPEVYKQYGPQDAWITRKLRDFVWHKLEKDGLDRVYWETEAPFCEVLYLMEQRGVGVNEEFCQNKIRIGNGRMATIRRELGIDPASSKQLGKFLLEDLKLPVLEHTATCPRCYPKERGRSPEPVETHEWAASFNSRVMAEYDDILNSDGMSNNPSAQHISHFRGWQKAVTSLYVPLVEKRGPDGLIRTEFKQHGTVTGRLSASNPNLQQVPRKTHKPWNGDAKSAFHSGRDGYALYGWDYSQLELRLAAAYGQEAVLLAEFEKDNADPFAVLAPQIFGTAASNPPWHCDECKINDQSRHYVKNGFVYPTNYGAGIGKIALVLGKSIAETRPIFERYKSSIPGITSISEQVIAVTKQRGWIKYWDGRIRHIRNPNDVHTRAWNSVLQGGASQLVKKAMIKIMAFEDENCFMVLQVHDEITFCIRRDLISTYEPLIKEAMTNWPNFGVRLTVEGKEWK